jgi:hypothetical protein
MADAITIIKKCVHTGKSYSVTVDSEDYFKWVNGELAQRAFPYLSVADREFLISGISPEGWDQLFEDEKEEEDDIVAYADAKFARDNDLPTEPRAEND